MDLFVKLILFICMISPLCVLGQGQIYNNSPMLQYLAQQYPNGAFDDKKPEVDPNNQQFKEYVKVLTRFDDWATGHTHVRGPEEVLPDDEFKDPTPKTVANNKAYKDYVNKLTRFDSWVTGHKVPIPSDPTTDALHQDLGQYGIQALPSSRIEVRQLPGELTGFNDRAPIAPPNKAFNDYKNELTRFDSWVTGKKVPIPADPATDALHQIFRRSVISSEHSFADKFHDRTPVNPVESPSYNDFVGKLKRFDPWITGQKVPIPRDSTSDTLHQISKRSVLRGNYS
ncbi:uncharacterized protein LOC135707809 [Ochlerotatus camptorhynchus]|uniref:uncharacterized protein LOC135707809 n=1 Tax=Ochlerotatus camptorhynchus TaxID=644619 RepID=UPI0031CEA6D6